MKFNTGRFNLPDKVSIKPIAQYTIDTSFGVLPLEVQFTDASEHDPVAWLWDFGDGTYSRLQNPTHTYTTEGIFDVKLSVVNSGGNDIEVKEGSIGVVYLEPVASFTYTYETPGSVVIFTDTSENTPTEWLWNFGDGNTSTEQNPTHDYVYPGSYSVSLRATNSAGASIGAAFIVIQGIAPTADFSMDVSTGYAPELEVTFTNLSTGNPQYFEWDFGDGTYSTEESPLHTYGVGMFVPMLTVTNSLGYDIKSDEVTVNDVTPTCSFTVNLDGNTIPRTVTITPITTGYPTVVEYSWGDGSTTTETIHTYIEPGTYTIEMHVYNTEGWVTFTGTPFTIDYAPPVADFDSDIVTGYEPVIAVRFYDRSTNVPTAWVWEFSDGQTSYEQNPVMNFSSSVSVTLTVSSAKGSDTITKSGYLALLPRTNTTIVAAYNSTGTEKFYADYVCNNESDNQSTINVAAERGGTLVLCGGNYNCNGNLKLLGVTLKGMGAGNTIINIESVPHATMHVSTASDFTLMGNGVLKVTIMNPGEYSLSNINASGGADSEITIDALSNGGIVYLDSIRVNDVNNSGFRFTGTNNKSIRLQITGCDANNCGKHGFEFTQKVNYNWLTVEDCNAIGNGQMGFDFVESSKYSFINNFTMSRCSAYNNYNGFCFVTTNKGVPWIKNCVAGDNLYANFYSYGKKTSTMIIQDCKSIGSENSILINGHGGIIFNRFIAQKPSEKILKVSNITDLQFVDGLIGYIDDELMIMNDETSPGGLTFVGLPRNIPDGQMNLSISEYNNLNVSMKSVMEVN